MVINATSWIIINQSTPVFVSVTDFIYQLTCIVLLTMRCENIEAHSPWPFVDCTQNKMADATATYFQLSAVLDGTLFTITIKKENDLGHSRGVVLSRAVHSCDLLRLNSLNGRFVRLR